MLKSLLQKLLGKRPEAGQDAQAKSVPMSSEQLERLVRDIARTNEIELNCGSTFDLIDEYVDRFSRGEDAATAMPMVRQHLDLCPECEEEYELLLEVVNALAGDDERTQDLTSV